MTVLDGYHGRNNCPGKITKKKTAICCGYLRYKFFDNNNIDVQQDDLSLAGAEFYVDNDIAEQHKQGKMSIFYQYIPQYFSHILTYSRLVQILYEPRVQKQKNNPKSDLTSKVIEVT